jgi:hypothetical protein
MEWLKSTDSEKHIRTSEIEELDIRLDRKNPGKFVILARLKSGQRRPIESAIPDIHLAVKKVSEIKRKIEEVRHDEEE